MYNAGFSAKNISAMTPWFTEEVLTYQNRLLKAADTGETIKLDKYTMDLTFDVIARTTLCVDHKLDACRPGTWANTKPAIFALEPSNRQRRLGKPS